MPTKPKRHKPITAAPTTTVERRRASSRQHGREWLRISRAHLMRHPLCADPFGIHAAQGTEAPATEVDHIVPLARGGTHHASNLQSCCRSCHSRKSVLCDGALGRAPRLDIARDMAARNSTQNDNDPGGPGRSKSYRFGDATQTPGAHICSRVLIPGV